MQMTEVFSFIDKTRFVHKLVVESGNVITGIGMFFRKFAETVLHNFGYDIGNHFMIESGNEYMEEELTFYWTDEEYVEFRQELKEYAK